jgi:flagellar FliJ protein
VRRFKFELEKVLDIRAYREQEARIALGRAVGVLSALERDLRNLAEERLRAASERFAPGNRGADMLASELYIRRLDGAKEKLLAQAAQAELRVAEAREAFFEASRERKVLDKLKERRRREYHAYLLGEEAKTLDDISGGAAARKRAGSGF